MSSLESRQGGKPQGEYALAELIGSPQFLPEKSEEAYLRELQAIVSDVQSNSPLALVLAEQLVEALLWVRRHSQDKACIILNMMAEELSDFIDQEEIRDALYSLQVNRDDEQAKVFLEKNSLIRGIPSHRVGRSG